MSPEETPGAAHPAEPNAETATADTTDPAATSQLETATAETAEPSVAVAEPAVVITKATPVATAEPAPVTGATALPDRDREFAYTDEDFQKMRQILNKLTGITLQERGREMIYNRLGNRLRELDLDSFRPYIDMVEMGGPEAQTFADALTTNTTHFFREDHHFDHLSNVLIPAWMADTSRPKRVRIWSAACSTGEEPYTAAMILKESHLLDAGFDVRILATDIDSSALEKARLGVYRSDCLENVSLARQKRWFQQGTGAQEGQVRLVPELRELITFNPLNLMGSWPIKGPFDVIFCRNVFIYFDADVTSELTARFSELLPPGGLLILGHSESMLGQTDLFESLGQTIYRRLEA